MTKKYNPKGFSVDCHCDVTAYTSVLMPTDISEEEAKTKAQEIKKTTDELFGKTKEDFVVAVGVEEIVREDGDCWVQFAIQFQYEETCQGCWGQKSCDWYSPDDPDEIDVPDAVGDVSEMIAGVMEKMSIPTSEYNIDDYEDNTDDHEKLFDRAKNNAYCEAYERDYDD